MLCAFCTTTPFYLPVHFQVFSSESFSLFEIDKYLCSQAYSHQTPLHHCTCSIVQKSAKIIVLCEKCSIAMCFTLLSSEGVTACEKRNCTERIKQDGQGEIVTEKRNI